MAEKKTGGVGKNKATSAKQNKKPVKTAKSGKVKGRGKKYEFSAKQIVAFKDKKSNVFTAEGKQLTIKEAKFIDNYIASGNIRQSVIEAGYKCGGDGWLAGQAGNELLSKPYIKAEIDKRMQDHHDKSIADREEIMRFWTDMMRGKILDQFDMPTTNADKLKAATELAKRGMDIEDRIREKSQSAVPEIKISLDWGGANGSEK